MLFRSYRSLRSQTRTAIRCCLAVVPPKGVSRRTGEHYSGQRTRTPNVTPPSPCVSPLRRRAKPAWAATTMLRCDDASTDAANCACAPIPGDPVPANTAGPASARNVNARACPSNPPSIPTCNVEGKRDKQLEPRPAANAHTSPEANAPWPPKVTAIRRVATCSGTSVSSHATLERS